MRNAYFSQLFANAHSEAIETCFRRFDVRQEDARSHPHRIGNRAENIGSPPLIRSLQGAEEMNECSKQ